jgi:RNA polymerase sigma factor (sigma-70 family)
MERGMNPHVFDGVLASAQQAQEWAWSEIYRWIAPQLGGYFRVRGVGDPHDLVGEVFLQIARNLGTFEGDVEGFRSWVFMIAHNRLSNERRRMGRRPLTLMSDVGPVDASLAHSAEDEALAGLDDVIHPLLQDLTADQRSVVALRIISGFSVEETAQIMQKSVGSVKQLQRRALESLRRQVVSGGVTK